MTEFPKPKPAPPGAAVDDHTALGLRVVWFVDRGPAGTVSFTPEQFKVYQDKGEGPADNLRGGNSPWRPGWVPPPPPTDGKFSVTATFSTPGVFVMRVLAHDGGLSAQQDVTVTVSP